MTRTTFPLTDFLIALHRDPGLARRDAGEVARRFGVRVGDVLGYFGRVG